MKVVKCPNCGASIYEGTFRCHKCGKIVPKKENKEAKEK